HTGIYLKNGGHHVVENNVVQNVLLLLNDGGAISIGSDGNIISGNFLLNSYGNTDESNGCGSTNSDPCMHHSPYGMGIGADSKFVDNVIEDNVIANNRDMGIRLNAFQNTIVRNNIVYNSDPGVAVQDKKGPSQNNLIENNFIYALQPDQLGLTLTNDTNHGVFQNNVYGNPYSEIVIKRDGIRYSLAHFQEEFPDMEQGSTALHVAFPEYTISQTGTNLIENSFFETDVAGWKPAAHVFHDVTQTAMDGGSLRAEYSDTNGDMNVIPNTMAIDAGQWYRLRFSVIGN
ncbi:MAG: right-handed parallel beta-helix repeat-containing protein, partial [bacterium]|nr:right-handed parallel beta-helix repeat-containing protein [bacterium]